MPTCKIRLRPPSLLTRLWHWKLGHPAPLLTSPLRPWHAAYVRLLPYRWRRLHRAYAQAYGFFWLPCPQCGREFGGHEAGADLADPGAGPGHARRICARCTRAGAGR